MEEIAKDRRFLVGEVVKVMIAEAKEKIPETGRFPAKQYRMKYPGSRHDGLLAIDYSESAGCTVQAGAIVEGTDMLIKNFAFWGNRDVCIAWLERPETAGELVDMLDKLMLRADEE